VFGFEIEPTAMLERPRVDVTLRISGLFRDVFPMQIALFDAAVRAVAALDEDAETNPLAHSEPTPLRIFGAAPGAYGIDFANDVAANAWTTRAELGRHYLEASGTA
jgi:cobaltochelatase CobN